MNNTLFVKKAEQHLNESEAVRKLSKKWKKGMIISLLKGIGITLVVVFLIAFILYCFVDIRIFPASY
jgi:hypothetical protein